MESTSSSALPCSETRKDPSLFHRTYRSSLQWRNHWEFSTLAPTLATSLEVKRGAGEGVLTLLAAKMLQVKVGEEMISVSKATGGKSLMKWARAVKYKYSAKPFQCTSPCMWSVQIWERHAEKKVVLQQNWKMSSNRNITPLCASLPLCVLFQYANVFFSLFLHSLICDWFSFSTQITADRFFYLYSISVPWFSNIEGKQYSCACRRLNL